MAAPLRPLLFSGTAKDNRRPLLLTFLWQGAQGSFVKHFRNHGQRPDVVAAARGGDPGQGMEGEGDPSSATLEQALFWRQVYVDILALEEKVMERMQDLMTGRSPRARREVELTSIPVVAAQTERFRRRLGFWTARVRELELAA